MNKKGITIHQVIILIISGVIIVMGVTYLFKGESFAEDIFDAMLPSFAQEDEVLIGGGEDIGVVFENRDAEFSESFKERGEDDVYNAIQYGVGKSLVNKRCQCTGFCEDYAEYIVEATKKENIPDPLILLSIMMQESRCIKTVSSSSSVGLMQIHLETWCGENGRKGLPEDEEECKKELIENHKKNIMIGAEILGDYYKQIEKLGKTHPREGNSLCRNKQCTKESCESKDRRECDVKFVGGTYHYEFTGCSGESKYYQGLEAALRLYNGWGCGKKNDGTPYIEQDTYADEVMGRFNLLAQYLENEK